MAPMTPPSRRRRWRCAPIGMSLLLLSGLVATACGDATASPLSPEAGQTITLYNAQHQQTTSALIAAFTKLTGIKVKVDNDDEDVLTAKIEQEGSRSPADLFYTENSNWLEQLNQRGMLAKVPAATLSSIPTADSAANGSWVGVSARFSVLVYNTQKLTAAQVPTSVMDLADPQWAGKIEIAPAETDFWPIVSSVDKAKGDAATIAWLQALKTNAGSNDAIPDNETITSDVGQGVSELGIINHYYYYRLLAEVGKASVNANISYFAPHDPGFVEDISGAATLKSSKHKAAAEQFLAFLTSQAGQTVLAHSESFEYPLVKGVAANAELTPLSKLQPADFTPADLGTGLDAKKLLQTAGLI